MKPRWVHGTFFASLIPFWFGALNSFGLSAPDGVNVVQHHNHSTRDGLYVDPAFTTNAAAHLERDTNFNGAIVGNVYAQLLYLEGGTTRW